MIRSLIQVQELCFFNTIFDQVLKLLFKVMSHVVLCAILQFSYVSALRVTNMDPDVSDGTMYSALRAPSSGLYGACTCCDLRRSYVDPAPALFIVTQLVKDNQQQSLAPNVINDCVTCLSNDTVHFDMDRAPSSSLMELALALIIVAAMWSLHLLCSLSRSWSRTTRSRAWHLT